MNLALLSRSECFHNWHLFFVNVWNFLLFKNTQSFVNITVYIWAGLIWVHTADSWRRHVHLIWDAFETSTKALLPPSFFVVSNVFRLAVHQPISQKIRQARIKRVDSAVDFYSINFLLCNLCPRPVRNCLVSKHLLVMVSKNDQNIDIVLVLVMK